MNAESEIRTAPSISGHMMDLGPDHSIAIYVRNGVCWMAEFRDGLGELTYAGEWFRFHSGGLRYCHNRRAAALKSAMPLSPEMVDKIERLYRAREARDQRMRATQRRIVAAAHRYWIGVMLRIRGGASKISQTLG